MDIYVITTQVMDWIETYLINGFLGWGFNILSTVGIFIGNFIRLFV